ncbi:MAG: hypothetical protein M1830_000517 [Pleopsidium flavum]|nr:MAG: hypothetical protein M1830_000517 [Pleopsidium flavum]
MSAVPSSGLIQMSSPVSKSKKSKKKKAAAKAKSNEESTRVNGTKLELEAGVDDGEDDEPETPTHGGINSLSTCEGLPADHDKHTNSAADRTTDQNEEPGSTSNGLESAQPRPLTNGASLGPADSSGTLDTEERIEAYARNRDSLREEVAELRRSLEAIQVKHQQELGLARAQLEETQGQKDHAETQYRNLLGKVNTIKSQLGERLKADAEELSQARSRIDELEDRNGTLKEENEARVAELAALAEEGELRSKELSSLRNRTNLSQQNWVKEREDLGQREAFARDEFEAAKQAMQDWEVLAMEERSIRENLGDRVAELEEQLSSHRDAYEKAASERDNQSLTVDGLQRALQEIQDARRRELRELVENSQAQVEELRKQLQDAEKRASDSSAALQSTSLELERALPFEREVKEKNLLIGKLRHEAVILNDHLTKALRFLKKGKPEDNIDRQIVTNHFLHFLALDRSDPKKFQILQLIAALLGWTDEQREQAGLARPGASNPNLRTPISPFHRTPSTPALTTDLFPENNNSKESLAELWSNFLEQEAQEGSKSSRSTSISSTPKPP